MNNKYKRKHIVAASLSAVFLCLYIFTTNPRTLPAPMLLVPPIIVFVLCFSLLRSAIGAFVRLVGARAKAIVIALSALPALLLMLAAAGQLGIRDALLTILFIGGLTWYFDRSRQNTQAQA